MLNSSALSSPSVVVVSVAVVDLLNEEYTVLSFLRSQRSGSNVNMSRVFSSQSFEKLVSAAGPRFAIAAPKEGDWKPGPLHNIHTVVYLVIW